LRTALSAAAAKKHVTDYRDIVEPAQTAFARRAARWGGVQRLAAWKAMDADIEKASDGKAQQDEDRKLGRVEGHCSRRGSSGIGKSGDCSETRTRPLTGSRTYGAPTGSTGWRITILLRIRPLHVYCSRAAGGKRRTTASS